MSFDQTWEQIFRTRSWGRYPNEDAIRFVARNYFGANDRKQIRILDLGSGGGANTWFLAREGFHVYAIDGSETAVAKAKAFLHKEGCSAEFRVGDIAMLDYPTAHFNAVLDMNVVQHNCWEDILRIHAEIFRVLKPGGQFFGMMLSEGTSGWETAENLGHNTFRKFKTGAITNNVMAHFFSRSDLEILFRGYESVVIDQLTRTDQAENNRICHYLATAKKKESADEY